MRIIPRDVPWITTHNPFEGDAGAALYVSPAGETAARSVIYRNKRLLPIGPAVICDTFPAVGDGPLGLDAYVALVKSPDPLTWPLPDDYVSSLFVVNVRPHADGLELDDISGAMLITTDDGEAADALLGQAIVLGTTKLDGGGVRVWFRYVPAPTGLQPTDFRVEHAIEPTSVIPAMVPANGAHDYYASVFGLDDGADYVLQIVGIAADDDVATTLTTFPVTGDDEGPDADVTLEAFED
jgi:hypothetical protein